MRMGKIASGVKYRNDENALTEIANKLAAL